MMSRTGAVLIGVTLLGAGCGGEPGGGPDAPGPDADVSELRALCVEGATPPLPSLFFDPGSTRPSTPILAAGAHLITGGDDGWRLRDADGEQLARGPGEPLAAATGLFMVGNAAQISLCSALDGSERGAVLSDTLGVPLDDGSRATFGIAPDGSYAWVGGADRLVVVSPDGAIRFTIDDVSFETRVHATADNLYVDAGDRLRIVDAATGALTLGPPFLGELAGWFVDAERYITIDGSTAHVHDVAGAELASFALPSLAQRASGHGDVVAVYHGNGSRILQVSFFRIGGGTAPFAQAGPFDTDQFAVTGREIAFPGPEPSFDVLEIGDTGVTRSNVVLPDWGSSPDLALVALPHGWAYSAGWGVVGVVSGDPDDYDVAIYGHGKLWSIDSAATGPVLIGTSAGTIALDPITGAEQWHALGAATRVVMSVDGSRAAILRAGTVELRDAATGAVLDQIPAVDGSSNEVFDLGLTADATAALLVRGSFFEPRAVLHQFADDVEVAFGIAADGIGVPVPSPDGTRFAVPTLDTAGATVKLTETNLYDAAGTLLATIDGLPIGWRDATTLLIERASDEQTVVAQVDAAGVEVATVTLAETSFWRFDDVDLELIPGGRLYGRGHEIFDLATGALVPWPGAATAGPVPDRYLAAATASTLVFAQWWGPVESLPLPE